MGFLQNIVLALVIVVTSLATATLGFFHVPQSPPAYVSPVANVATTTSDQAPTIPSPSSAATAAPAASGSPLGNTSASTTPISTVHAPQTSQQPDCGLGTPIIDLQGDATVATKTTTHVYTELSDNGGPSSNNPCGGYTLVGADPQTFVALDQFYGKDATGVWFIQNPWSGSEGGTDVYQIGEADAATFTLIPDSFRAGPWPHDPYEGFSPWYTKDKNHVYFYDQVVVGADPATFAVDDPPAGTSCDFYDAHDALHYYYRGGLRPPPAQWTDNCP